MDLIAHLVFGFWLYIKLGNPWSILLSCIMDVDHLLGYLYDRRKESLIKIHYDKLIEEIFEKPYDKKRLLHLSYRPRTWFHSIFGVFLFSLVLTPFLSLSIAFIPLFSHLLLDAMDKNGIYILPPFTKRKVRGALPVGYLIEDPKYLVRHKRSHIPSLILIIITIFLILFGI